VVSNSMWEFVSGSCSTLTCRVSPASVMPDSICVKNVSWPPEPSSPKKKNTFGYDARGYRATIRAPNVYACAVDRLNQMFGDPVKSYCIPRFR